MMYSMLKSILFRMDPERAHHLTIDALSAAQRVPGALAALRAMYGVPEHAELATTLWGLRFPHPIGLSAGLDKNGAAAEAFAAVGFGFVEVGTVTPKAQPGNELPRLFRLKEHEALINRMGFNNAGAEAMADSLSRCRLPVPLFINIGKNKTTPNEIAAEDYVSNLNTLYDYGQAFVVNVSSPNTPGLRNLQQGDEMRALLGEVTAARDALAAKAGGVNKPVLVKIAPDLTDEQLADTVAAVALSGVDGIVATNTTLSRDGIRHPHAGEAGGLSGKPLKQRSTEVIRDVYRATGGELPIIGTGGIFTAHDAYEKIRAGASLVQVYTALIYEGPGLVRRLAEGVRSRALADGFRSVAEAVGKS
ncbi:quinone-dependent dihydroorotate dehydrogenase [Paenibacillus sp.]|uniref:quinone-dependent dihydroorotate dehydrogenase n=1 Tax=Paenibacillus sp. TaxID=58172 RepID=UPI002D6A9ABD|nr:quinone-dependent dihydroorotate dehydrogenase [Paenibacillus sp.]HZG87251.1 quinone-dependent dihydroorotate dehydrogenase [Paenibacillus sp.]